MKFHQPGVKGDWNRATWKKFDRFYPSLNAFHAHTFLEVWHRKCKNSGRYCTIAVQLKQYAAVTILRFHYFSSRTVCPFGIAYCSKSYAVSRINKLSNVIATSMKGLSRITSRISGCKVTEVETVDCFAAKKPFVVAQSENSGRYVTKPISWQYQLWSIL